MCALNNMAEKWHKLSRARKKSVKLGLGAVAMVIISFALGLIWPLGGNIALLISLILVIWAFILSLKPMHDDSQTP